MAGATRSSTVTVIRPSAGWRAVDLGEIWRTRDLLWTLAVRDVKLRYRQTALGVIWVVLQPLLGAGIFSFIFGKVAKLPSDGVPYFVFAYAGLLGWNVFGSALGKSSSSLVGNGSMMSKIYFPRLILPLSTIVSTLLDFCVALVVMAVILFQTHTSPGAAILTLPLWLLLLLALSMGLGVIAGGIMVSYRDVTQILPVLVQLLLYASPIAYALSAIPKNLRFWYSLNPLVGAIEGFRWSLIGHVHLHLWVTVYSAVWALGLFAVGALAFTRMERKFADVI